MTLDQFIENALAEDIGSGDHTSLACIPEDAKGKAVLLAKESGILAGVAVAIQIAAKADSRLIITAYKKDGDPINPGDQVFHVHGPSRSILVAERLMLNCMQRMSGIATRTHEIQELIAPFGCKVLDTRKTTPGMRELEKWAVRIGGGTNHRMGLYDMMMIKDNHIDYAGGIRPAIEKANSYISSNHLSIKIEIEARDLGELKEILAVGKVHRIMLDNFTPEDMKTAVELIGKRYETEASGGITEATITDYARTGVDYISVGALTHSVKSLDLSLKAVK
jgi:nicotinate-nucleotide pyrophosphorylase (carboxylating)